MVSSDSLSSFNDEDAAAMSSSQITEQYVPDVNKAFSSVSAEELHRLVFHAHPKVRAAAVLNSIVTMETLQDVANQETHTDVITALLERNDLNVTILITLVNNVNRLTSEQKNCLVNHPNVTHEVIKAMYFNSSNDTRFSAAVLEHPLCPVELLKLGSQHYAPVVRAAALRNPKTPDRVKIFKDETYDVHRNVLFDPLTNTPSSLDTVLLQEYMVTLHDINKIHNDTLIALSEHPQMTSSMLHALSRSCHVTVRSNIAIHRNVNMLTLRSIIRETPAVHLYVLEQDIPPFDEIVTMIAWYTDNTHVAELISQRYMGTEVPAGIAEGLLNSKTPQVRINGLILTNDPVLLSRISDDESSEVRAKVASHSCVSSDTLHVLAKDTSKIVRYNVACNVSSTDQTLNMLAYDVDSHVRKAVQRHPNSSEETRIIAALR